VHLGYPGGFGDFLNYLRKRQTPFNLMLQYTQLEAVIRSAGCKPWICRFDQFIDDGWRELDRFLGISTDAGNARLEQVNAGLGDAQLQQLLRNNRNELRGLGLRISRLVSAGSMPPLDCQGDGVEADAAGDAYIEALERDYWHPLQA
jgi:hypothetical protein